MFTGVTLGLLNSYKTNGSVSKQWLVPTRQGRQLSGEARFAHFQLVCQLTVGKWLLKGV